MSSSCSNGTLTFGKTMRPSKLWEAKLLGGSFTTFTPERDEDYIHISSIELASPVGSCPNFLPIDLIVNGKKTVIAALTPHFPRVSMNLKIATQFELFHSCKDLAVYVRGHSVKLAGTVVPNKYDFDDEFDVDEETSDESEDGDSPPEMVKDKETYTPSEMIPMASTRPSNFLADSYTK